MAYGSGRLLYDYSSDVAPWQLACPQAQSMSGVFSMASHWALQYLPDVTMHEQTGCAHFVAFVVAIIFSQPRTNRI